MEAWKSDLGDSAFDFLRVVWPVIGPLAGGGELLPVEAVETTKMNRNLDILAGIDAWQVDAKGGRMRGIASRVQWGRAWDSFTIRTARDSGNETELAKRVKALERIEEGWLFPALTVQAYVTERRIGELLSVAWIRTRDLIDYASAYKPELDQKRSNADFVAAYWDCIRGRGYTVNIHPEPPPNPFLSYMPDEPVFDEDDHTDPFLRDGERFVVHSVQEKHYI